MSQGRPIASNQTWYTGTSGEIVNREFIVPDGTDGKKKVLDVQVCVWV